MIEPDRSVVDDVEQRRFRLRQNGAGPKLLYRVDPGNRLVLVHTEVPEPLRGRGIAGRLVRAAIERAAASGETVVPLCSFVRKWLGDHPEIDGRVLVDWSDPPGVLVGSTR